MTFYVSPNGQWYWRRGYGRPSRNEQEQATEYDVIVPVNVKAEEDEYVVTALIPGVKADDLSVSIHNETLTIQGELADFTEGDTKQLLVREMPYGRFYRVIQLPEPLNSTKAQADLTNGVLTLRVPKAEEAKPKTIKVVSNN